MNRRTFLQYTLQASAGLALAASALPKAMAASRNWLPAHTLPQLPYAYDALAPYIDAETMRIHHSKHHQAYVDNLNKALTNHADLQDLPVEQLIQRLDQLPADIRTAVRNNGGGHANHTLFWTLLTPKPARPSEAMIGHLNRSFGTFGQFKAKFEQAAKDVFGSGWAWLVKQDGKLAIVSTANQDSPLMPVNGQPQGTPILGLDVWEHAYYLKYQNKRADYITAFWSVLNWAEVERRWKAA